MKVLLVSFQTNTDTVGLKYVHSYLCKNNIDSHILFIPKYDKKDFPPIEKFLQEFKPEIIGVSLMSEEFYNAKDASIKIKKKFPSIIIVLGGLHPSIDPKECLNFADYVFVGESEQSFLEFIDGIQSNQAINHIQNLAYKSSDKIVINKLRPLNEDLDSLPFPEHFPKKSFVLHKKQVIKLNKRIFKKYIRYSGRFYSLTTTRGCPFSCSYCCNSFFSNLYGKNIIRKRSVENVIEELRWAIKLYPNIIYINIQDDCFFTCDIEWMKKFAEMYKIHINKNFLCRTTPVHLTEEKIKILKGAGLSWVLVGLQSGSERINKKIYNRIVPNERFIEATKLLNKYKIACNYDLILDNPYETEEDLLKTINVILKIQRPFTLQLFSLRFYQGTELYSRALKEGLQINNPLEKNYYVYKPTFLNKVIRLCPLFPNQFIKFLVKHRKSLWITSLVSIVYFPSIIVLEPIIWIKLTLISFNYNIFKTLDMSFSFMNTGFNKIVLRKIG